MSKLSKENKRLRQALRQIIETVPQIVCDGNARVNDPDNIGWNVHMDAKKALLQRD